jgi:hypothetical protein
MEVILRLPRCGGFGGWLNLSGDGVMVMEKDWHVSMSGLESVVKALLEVDSSLMLALIDDHDLGASPRHD